MCTIGVLIGVCWVRVVIGISVIGGLWRSGEDVVSETYDLGLLGVVGVTLLEFAVFDTEDSGVEGILGADGDISEEESRILEMFSIGYLWDNLLLIIFYSAVVTSFEWASG